MLYVTGLALVIGGAIGLARGGRPHFLARHRLRAWWLVAAGFAVQLATDRLNVGSWGTVMVLLGAAALLAFAVVNPNLVGIGVVATGVALNALVIGLNDGMPVRPRAVVAAHIASPVEELALGYGERHHREQPSDRLRPADDNIPIPLFHEVVSFGDLILAVGVATTIAGLFKPVPRHTLGAPQPGPDQPKPPTAAPGPDGPAQPGPDPAQPTTDPAELPEAARESADTASS